MSDSEQHLIHAPVPARSTGRTAPVAKSDNLWFSKKKFLFFVKFEQYFTLIWSFSRSFIVYFPFVSLAPRPFWGMKKHPLNFNEMNSIFERCVTNKAIGAKRQRNKKKNLVKRDHHKISFSSWWLIRMRWGWWGRMKKCCPSYTLLLGYVFGREWNESFLYLSGHCLRFPFTPQTRRIVLVFVVDDCWSSTVRGQWRLAKANVSSILRDPPLDEGANEAQA